MTGRWGLESCTVRAGLLLGGLFQYTLFTDLE